MQEYRIKLKENRVNVEGLLIPGATIEMVIAESIKLKADWIITGHQEHSFLCQAFVGSVSTRIIKKSKIPVLIVPLE